MYDILGIARDASADDIKMAYRKAALKWHPGQFERPMIPMQSLHFKPNNKMYRFISLLIFSFSQTKIQTI